MRHHVLTGPALAAFTASAAVLATGLAIVLTIGGASAVGVSQAPGLVAVDAIEPGQWQLREVGTTAPPRSVCVTDPSTLIQIEHGTTRCTRFVVTDQPRTATISYTCPGAGSGRTTIKLESSNDFHLDTQGINGGAPFDKGYQAHRLGPCAAAAH